MDPDLLISEVKKRPAIWDKTNPEHKDRKTKFHSWVEVASVLAHDFHTKTEAQKKNTVMDVMERWRGIRDNFVRFRKQQYRINRAGSKRKTRYLYEEQLLFLDKCINYSDIRNRNDYEQHDKPQIVINYTESQPAPSNSIQEHDSGTTENNLETIKHEECDITENLMLENDPDVPATKKLRMNNDIDGCVNYVQEQKEPSVDDDEDLAFFKSMLTSVKMLDMDQKLTFRIQSMQFLQNLIRSNAVQE